MSLLERAKKDGRRFLNPVPTAIGGFSMMFKVLPLYLRNREEVEPREPLGPFVTDPEAYVTAPESGLRLTWFGHSSVLIEIDGVRVLTDPIWERAAGPFGRFGPRRFFPPTLPLEQLPPIDVVLLSHDHYDHLGSRTVRRLAQLTAAQNTVWVTSLGVGRRLQGFGVRAESIRELDWTQSAEIAGAQGTALKVTAWPARHFSGRGLHDRFTTLWSSFVLEGPKHRVYYGADSGYWEGFAEIAAHYERFDLTMLEIGAFHPLWQQIHLGPDNAARAYREMGGPVRAGLFFPIHWGLFNLALHAWKQPIQRLLEIAAEAPVDFALWLPEPGRPTEVRPEVEQRSLWWDSK